MESWFRNTFLKIFDSHLDLLICFITLFLSLGLFIFSLSIGSNSTAEMGLVIFTGCLLYLLFNKKILADRQYAALKISKKGNILLNIFFLVLYSASLVIAYTELYLPQIFFFLLAIMVFLIVMEILSENSKIIQWKILTKIILLALNIRYSVFFEYPGLSGADAWIHMNIIETIIKSNFIVYVINAKLEIYNFYLNLPNMHLLVAITKIIIDVPYKEALFLSIGLICVMGILFIYLFNSAVFNNNWACLATLVISIVPLLIIWGEVLIPNSVGIVFFSIFLYLIIQKNPNKRFLVLLLIFIFASIYTHTVSPFITVILLCSMLIFDIFYKNLYEGKIVTFNVNFRILIIFISALTLKWIFEAYNQTNEKAYSFVELVLPSFADMLLQKSKFVGDIIYAPGDSPLNRIWFLICLLFMTIGIFYFLAKKYRNNVTFSIAFSVILLSCMVVFFTIFNIISLMPHRWVIFIMILGSPLLIGGLYGFVNLFDNKLVNLNILILLIVVIFSIFSLFSATLNSHTPFYSSSTRSRFTDPELDALSTISKYNVDKITTDYDYGAFPLKNLYSEDFAQLSVYNQPTDLIILRKYIIVHKEFLYYRPQVREDIVIDVRADKVLNAIQTQKYNTIFNNGDIFGYKKRTLSA